MGRFGQYSSSAFAPTKPYNQERANVRNFCVGLTKLELVKEIKMSLEANQTSKAKYITEYLLSEF